MPPRKRPPPRRNGDRPKPTGDRPKRTGERPVRAGEGPKQWGGVARRGASNVRDGGPPGKAQLAWRDAAGLEPEERPRWEPEQWVREDAPVRREAGKAVSRANRPGRDDNRKRPVGPRGDDAKPVARKAPKAGNRQKLADAARAYTEEHYRDARRLLVPLAQREPDSAAVRELYGLTLYRLGRWKDAIVELEAFERLTGTLEQHPVLADCYRALRRWKKVEELWDELRQASPGADLVNEGRIVAAGALADRGNLQSAISLLEKAPDTKRPKDRHLRLWYALADLRERAGDIPGARELFQRIVRHDASFADAPERLSAVGR